MGIKYSHGSFSEPVHGRIVGAVFVGIVPRTYLVVKLTIINTKNRVFGTFVARSSSFQTKHPKMNTAQQNMSRRANFIFIDKECTEEMSCSHKGGAWVCVDRNTVWSVWVRRGVSKKGSKCC